MTDKKDDLFEPEDGLFDKSGAEQPFKEEPVLMSPESSSNPSFVTEGYQDSKAAAGKSSAKKASAPMDAGKKKKLKIAAIAGAVVIAFAGATVMNMSGPAPKAKSTTAKSQPTQQSSGEIASAQDPAASPEAAQITDPFASPAQGESGAAVADQFAQSPQPGADPFVDPFADPGAQGNPAGAAANQFVQQDLQFVIPGQTPPTDPSAPAQQSVYSPLPGATTDGASDVAVTTPAAPAAPQAMDSTASTAEIGQQFAMLQQSNAQQKAQIDQLREENARLAKELAAAQSANPSAASTTTVSNTSEVTSLKRQVRNLQVKNAQLQKVAKRSTAELEKVAKGEESDVVIAYRKASGIDVANAKPSLLTVKAISNDLAIVQKGEDWHYVKQGDSFDGIFVKSVNPVKGVVVTNQGTFSAQ